MPKTHKIAITLISTIALLAITIFPIACGNADRPTEPPEQPVASSNSAVAKQPTVAPEPQDTSDKDPKDKDCDTDDKDSDSQSSASNNADDQDAAVSNPNQVSGSLPFDWSPNEALKGTEPQDAIEWTLPPTHSLGGIDASGTLKDGYTLFDPTTGEGAAFAIYHDNYDDKPMLVFLPTPNQSTIWDTTLTYAETDIQIDGNTFTIAASSPLFFDFDTTNTKLHIYGHTPQNTPTLLTITPIK